MAVSFYPTITTKAGTFTALDAARDDINWSDPAHGELPKEPADFFRRSACVKVRWLLLDAIQDWLRDGSIEVLRIRVKVDDLDRRYVNAVCEHDTQPDSVVRLGARGNIQPVVDLDRKDYEVTLTGFFAGKCPTCFKKFHAIQNEMPSIAEKNRKGEPFDDGRMEDASVDLPVLIEA